MAHLPTVTSAQCDVDQLDESGAPDAILSVKLLGGFSVQIGGRLIPARAWRRRKAANLVTLLALSPGFSLPREQAQETLWPALAPRAAANNLHQTLHAARRILEPDPRAIARSPWLRLDQELLILGPPGAVRVDVEEFVMLTREARSSRSVTAYERALALYSGDLLPAELYEDWITARRQGLRDEYIDLQLALARLQESDGQIDAAINTLERLLADEAAHEAAHTTLMRLFAISGDRYRALRQYDRLRDALWQEIEAEPDPASERLRAAILSGQFPPARAAGDLSNNASQIAASEPQMPHNLPAQPGRLVGRERETEELLALMGTTRLLTLMGVGGSGKTRLALHIAGQLLPGFRDGVWFVDLAPANDPAAVPQAVATALGVREEPAREVAGTLAAYLAGRDLLLLFDNCEHLGASCATLAARLLGAAPRLRILTTSREPLRVADEVCWPVPPLAIPDLDDASNIRHLARNAAVQLFIERARRLRADFTLDARNAAAVVKITRQLEGLPLAIELAAARVGVLAAGQIADRLDDALRLLRTTDPSVPPKHQTLRATLDWSYTLLGEASRALFRRLAVFAGGAAIEAVEAVCSSDVVDEADVLDLLDDLVSRSLVAAEERQGQMRYRFLEPVRQYAALQLGAVGELERLRDAHLSWYMKLAEEAEAQMRGPDQVAWFNRVEIEHDNLRTALAWALEHDEVETALQLAVQLTFFWSRSGYLREGRAWIERALAASVHSPSSLRAKALHATGRLALSQTDLAQAEAFLEESLALARALPDELCMARVLNDLGNLWWHRADYQRAAANYEEALTLNRSLNDTYGVAAALHNLGLTSLYLGNLEEARARQEESLTLLQALGNQEGVAVVLHALGQLALDEGEHEVAVALLQQSVELSHDLGYRSYIAHGMMALAAVAVDRKHWERAARLMGAAEALREAIGSPLPPNERAWIDPYLDSLRAHLPAERLAAAWAAGRGLSLEAGIAETLEAAAALRAAEGRASPAMADGSRPSLTRRERQVAGCIARGLTNREIADELGINVRTVETHVTSILRKLNLQSRTDVAAWLASQPDLSG